MRVLEFVETKLFTELVGQYLSDEEYLELQLSPVANPEAGDPKNEEQSIPGHILRKIKEEIDDKG